MLSDYMEIPGYYNPLPKDIDWSHMQLDKPLNFHKYSLRFLCNLEYFPVRQYALCNLTSSKRYLLDCLGHESYHSSTGNLEVEYPSF